ncbi:MAG TPA: UbiA family prenyltransferase [Thermoflexia bacterium]|nr:UbiA family prenyltransferase [Thermoflexia bacterium]
MSASRAGVLRFLSWRHWGLLRYNSIFQNAALFFYIALERRWFAWSFLRDVGLFLLLSLAGTAYGYLVNDWADLDLDRRAGKRNVFLKVGRGRGLVVVGVALALVLALAVPFRARPGFLPLLGAWWFFATFYSVPPVRLKERGLLGLAATILAQQPLPAAMAFAALGDPVSWGAVLFLAYITMRGICSDVGHQMRDRERDVQAGARTFAARYGHRAIARIYGISLELETLLLGAVLALLVFDLPTVEVAGWSLPPALPLLMAYLALLPFVVGRAWVRLERGEWVDPYDESPEGPPRDLLHLVHQPFPTVVLPLYLAVWLACSYWPNVLFVLGLAGLYGLYDPRRWAGSWPVRVLSAWFGQRKGA